MWWAELPEPDGSAPGYRRPVVIVQGNAYNRSRLSTVTIIALTSNIRLVEAPGNVLISARASRLPRDSVANVTQLFTIDRRRLVAKVSELSGTTMLQIDSGMRMALDL